MNKSCSEIEMKDNAAYEQTNARVQSSSAQINPSTSTDQQEQVDDIYYY